MAKTKLAIILSIILTFFLCSISLQAQDDQESAISHTEEEALEAQASILPDAETNKPPGFIEFLVNRDLWNK